MDRRALINAFPDKLIGIDPDGSTSYWSFKLREEWISEPGEFAGFRGLILNEPTSFSRVEEAEVVDDMQQYRTDPNFIYMRPPGVETDIGGGGGSGGGTGGRGLGLPITPCYRMGYRDINECLNCCESRLGWGMGATLALAGTLVAGCLLIQFPPIIGVAACLAISASVIAVLTATVLVGHLLCRNNCNETYGGISLQPALE